MDIECKNFKGYSRHEKEESITLNFENHNVTISFDDLTKFLEKYFDDQIESMKSALSLAINGNFMCMDEFLDISLCEDELLDISINEDNPTVQSSQEEVVDDLSQLIDGISKQEE